MKGSTIDKITKTNTTWYKEPLTFGFSATSRASLRQGLLPYQMQGNIINKITKTN